MIEHTTKTRGILIFTYSHLVDVSVEEGDRVRRGTRIGKGWISDHPRWIPHVHIALLASDLPEPEQDPLWHLFGCASIAPPNTLAFPIAC